ncbi:MAG: DUF1398 domain-containing protein [Sphingomonadales bacterium 63-6]|nr:MAG: DUF1398 domain-containing protein [Sphingomonadales bacterium 63-6]
MNEDFRLTAQNCMQAAHSGALSFPEIVGTLMQAGFEGYTVDFRCGEVTYYHSSGAIARFADALGEGKVAENFGVEEIRAAIAEAQALLPGYTYAGFCQKVRSAGCAAYHVSIVGRRAVYFGKTGECHVEYFPQQG